MSNRRFLARGLLVVLVIGLAAGYTLGAQQSMDPNQRSTQPGQRMSQMPGQTGQILTLVRTDKLIGKDVKDTQGQAIGKIEDVVLSQNLKQVSYIALNAEDKHYAVPWSALKQGVGDTYTLSISKQDLSKAQPFTQDQWPAQASAQLALLIPGATMSSGQGIGSSQQGIGSSQQGTGSSQPGMGSSRPGAGASDQGMAQSGQPFSSQIASVEQRRVTKLDGTQVKDNEDNDIGSIKGFVIDLGGMSSAQIGSRTQTGSSMGAAGTTGAADSRQTGSSTGTAGSSTGAAGSSTGYSSGTTYGQSGQVSSSQPGMGRQAQSGQLVFTILSVNGGKYSLVPSNLVNIQAAQHTAKANADKETVDSLAFALDNFPNLSNRQYVQQVYQKFGQQPYWSAFGYVPPEQPSQSGQMGQPGRTGQTGQTGQTGTSQTDQSRTGTGQTDQSRTDDAGSSDQ